MAIWVDTAWYHSKIPFKAIARVTESLLLTVTQKVCSDSIYMYSPGPNVYSPGPNVYSPGPNVYSPGPKCWLPTSYGGG